MNSMLARTKACFAPMMVGAGLAAILAGPAMARQETQQTTDEVPRLQRLNEVIGHSVTDQDKERVGYIQDLVLDVYANRVVMAVASYDDLLGMEKRLFAIPWQALTKGAQEAYRLSMDRERVKEAPSFASNNTPNWADPSWGRMISEFYGVRPLDAWTPDPRAREESLRDMFRYGYGPIPRTTQGVPRGARENGWGQPNPWAGQENPWAGQGNPWDEDPRYRFYNYEAYGQRGFEPGRFEFDEYTAPWNRERGFREIDHRGVAERQLDRADYPGPAYRAYDQWTWDPRRMEELDDYVYPPIAGEAPVDVDADERARSYNRGPEFDSDYYDSRNARGPAQRPGYAPRRNDATRPNYVWPEGAPRYGDAREEQQPLAGPRWAQPFTRLVGLEVLGYEGNFLGELEDAMVDMRNGRLAYALLQEPRARAEGYAVVPWAALVFRTGRNVVALDSNWSELKQVMFREGELDRLNNTDVALRVHDVLGRKPYWWDAERPLGQEPVYHAVWQPGSGYNKQYHGGETVTLRGMVRSSGTFRPNGYNVEGLRLRVDTEDGRIAIVYAGPRDYAMTQDFDLGYGDEVVVEGARVNQDGYVFVMAREIRHGEEVLRLRDEQGDPLWSMARSGTDYPTAPPEKDEAAPGDETPDEASEETPEETGRSDASARVAPKVGAGTS